MDRLFEDSFVRPSAISDGGSQYGFPLDVTSSKDALVVEAALPGINPDDVEITVENGTLNIRGESNSERTTGEGENLVREIRRGSVSRVIALPNGLEPDKATATFEHGMLTLRIPKAEAVKPRQIRITPTVDGHSTNGSTIGSTAPADNGAGTATSDTEGA
jgi:HSP20 family protein